jgi:excisionase family DNA binding protein
MKEQSTNGQQSQLDRIEAYLFVLKTTFTFKEACLYTGFSPSYLYKLTSLGRIPFSKPEGKKIFFIKAELDEWLQRNHQRSTSDIEVEANKRLLKK